MHIDEIKNIQSIEGLDSDGNIKQFKVGEEVIFFLNQSNGAHYTGQIELIKGLEENLNYNRVKVVSDQLPATTSYGTPIDGFVYLNTDNLKKPKKAQKN